jgi:CheY-like chemotaxis protein
MIAGTRANTAVEKSRLERQLAERVAIAEKRIAQLRSLAGRLTESEQHERRRLAERLHGELQQLLTVAVMRLAAAKKKMGGEPGVSMLDEIEHLIRESIDEARSLTLDLSPPILRHGPFARAVEWLAERMVETHGFRVLISTDSDELDVPSARCKALLFDAVRELLFNAFRHSGVGEAEIVLRTTADELTVIVTDQGGGCNPGRLQEGDQPADGFGLFSIRERLALLGGRASYESVPGAGFRAELTVPLAADATCRAKEVCSVPASAIERADVPPGVIRVLLADDHRLMRAGLASLINTESDLAVIAEAPDGELAVELALRLRPDVIVMDVNMPRRDGTQATRLIRAGWPAAKIIGLSEYGDSVTERAMREAGALGYLYKDGPAEELTRSIRVLGFSGQAVATA